ncbi:MAG TPA: two-component regulator propeller domain-containing protein [Flavobacteriales bacterium]|nr:two-component regulator propeller domain-containing protein [Flavobacteriales bacterium]
MHSYRSALVGITLLPFLILMSCSGQVRTEPHQEQVDQGTSPVQAVPRMVRTLGAASGNVRCELQDRAGNLWFSTGGEGVYRYDGTSFQQFTTRDGLCHDNASAIIQDRAGNILIATDAGICRYDGTRFSSYLEADSLKNLRITSLLEDRDGSIWFGTLNDGVYRYDGARVQNFLNDDAHTFNLGNSDQLIMDLLQDRQGHIWFSTWNGGGVWRFDGTDFRNFLPSEAYYRSNQDGRSMQPITYTPPDGQLPDDMIFSIAEDRAGNLWFATRRHGASRYDGQRFTPFQANAPLVQHGLHAILEDRKGNLWFTTDKNGVYRYDGITLRNFTTTDGLANNSVFSILEDSAGHLWFGTRGFGLSRYDGERFTTYSE